jgi:hypothetical protein
MFSWLAGAFPGGFGTETGEALALWASCVGWSAVRPLSWPAPCVSARPPGWPFGCVPAGEPAPAAGDVLSGAGALDGGTATCGAATWGVVAGEAGAGTVVAVDVGAGVGVPVAVGAVETVGAGAGWGEAVDCWPELPRRPFTRLLTPVRSPSIATWAGSVGSVLPSAAWDAGTPADRTSTAPTAAAAAPRRSPPWILVRERENSDL